MLVGAIYFIICVLINKAFFAGGSGFSFMGGGGGGGSKSGNGDSFSFVNDVIKSSGARK